MRKAMLSAAPRNCAASSAGRSRGGFGSRTLVPLRPAASGPKAMVRSSRSAIARNVAAVARLKISVGDEFGFGHRRATMVPSAASRYINGPSR